MIDQHENRATKVYFNSELRSVPKSHKRYIRQHDIFGMNGWPNAAETKKQERGKSTVENGKNSKICRKHCE